MIEEFLSQVQGMSERDRLDVVYGYLEVDGFTYQNEIEKDESHWSMITWSIFERNGRYLAVQWERGLTENQEHYVEFNNSTVFEVAVFEKIVIDYQKA